FATSFDLPSLRSIMRRSDDNGPLSGFKECEGTFPNKVTEYSYHPNPAVSGQKVTQKTHAIDNEPIEDGSKLNVRAYYKNSLVHNHVTDFCKEWGAGGKCSGAVGHVQYENTQIVKDLKNIKHLPRNQPLDMNMRVELHSPQNKTLCCMEGVFRVIIKDD
ncbi:8307_t:CDS:2, partial [Cetraspora pellucida]